MTDHSPEGIAKLVKSLRQVAVTPINLDAGETWIDEWVREKFQAAAEALERLAGGRDEARRNALDELLSLDEASVRQQDGVVTFAGRGKVVPILATALYEVLASVSATNYVELRLGATNPQTDIEDPLVLRLQREQGKTPDQLKREAEARVTTLEKDLVDARAHRDCACLLVDGKALAECDYHGRLRVRAEQAELERDEARAHAGQCAKCRQWTCGYCGIHDEHGAWYCERCWGPLEQAEARRYKHRRLAAIEAETGGRK